MGADKRLAAEMFGAQIRWLRENAGLTIKGLGDEVSHSEHTIRSWERGLRVPPVETIQRLDDLLSANGALVAGVRKLHNSPRYPQLFLEYAELEATCVSLYAYNTTTVPGLLQTEEFARAVISAHVPPREDDEIERLVAGRIGRQVLLTRKPAPILAFVIEEAALRRHTGGPDVLRDQLRRLVEVAALRHVTIQVMPMEAEQHSGLDGPMFLVRTSGGREVAYTEGQGGGAWITDPDGVAVIGQRHAMIRTQALRAGESLTLIEKIAGEL